MSTKNTRIGVIMESKGGKKVAADLERVGKSTETVGRQQTRLGQASASAGRQFSAQASGLGGLVAAYAGAAATVFALQAAFDALSRAARAETIVQGTKTLALEIGQSGPRILKQVQEITQGQLELSEAAQNINIALSAGFNSDQIERLSKVSLGASRALGRNLTDALQRVVRGAAKLEPELLDELGIFTRIDPAVEAYAQKLGVASSNLSDFERRQAFVNAVIEEGERKFGSIDVASASTQKSLEQLQAQITELGLEFGKLIGDFLLPVVNFFKNNVGNTLLLFGGILALVFGKATEIFGNFAKNSLNSLSDFASGLADNAAKSRGSLDIIRGGVEELNDTIKGRGGLSAGDGSFTKGLTRDVSTAAADARRRFLSGEQVDSKQRAKDVQTLTKAQQQLTAANRAQSAAFKDSRKIIDTYTGALNRAGTKAKLLTAFSVGLQTVIRGVGIAASFAGKALNSMFFIVGAAQLVGSFFDIDILKAVKDFFVDTSQAANDLSDGLKALTLAAAGGAGELTKAIKNINEDFDFETLDKKIAKTEKRLLKLQKRLSQRRVGGTTVFSAQDDATFETAALKSIEGLQKRINEEKSKGAKADQEELDDLRIQLILVKELLEAERRFGLENQKVAGQLARFTGIPLDRVALSFEEGALGVDRFGDSLKIAGIEAEKIDGKFTFGDVTDDQRKAIEANVIFNDTLRQTQEAFAAGALNSEKLGARLAGLSSQFDTLNEFSRLTPIELKRFEEQIAKTRTEFETLKTLETIGKGITKAFGGALKAIDTARFKGLVDESGKLAKDSKEIAKNQAQFLLNTIEGNRDAFEQVQENNAKNRKSSSILQQQAQNFTLATKATAGEIFKIFQESQKLIKTEEIKAIQLKNQTESLKEQLAVLLEQNLLAQKQATQKAQVANSERELTIDQKRFDLSKEIAKARDEEFKAGQKLLDLKTQELTTQQNIANIQRDADIASARAGRQTQISGVQATLDDAQDDPRSTEAGIFALRRKLIELEKNNATKIAEEDSRVANENYVNELAIISAKKTILGNELDNLETRTLQQLSADRTEKDLLTQRQAIETQKIQNEKENLLARFNIDNQIALNALNDIDRREALFEVQNKSNMAQVENNKVFLKSVQALNEGEFVKALKAFLSAEKGIELGTDNFGAELIKDAEASLNKASNLLTSNADAQAGIFNQEREIQNAKKDQLLELFNIENGALAKKLEDTAVIQQIEQDALAQKQAANLAALAQEEKVIQQQLQNIQTESDASFAALQQKLAGIEIEKQKTMQALNTRLDVLNKEANVAEQLKMQTAAIAKSNLTGFFMEMNEAFINGSATFSSISNSFKDMVGNMLREIQAAVFRKTIVNPLVEGLVGGIPFLSAAGGGVQHKASGGMLRDRVPALLEPGEFVISRRGAKAIGIDNLQALNAGVEKDAESKLLASLFGKKVKKMVAGGRSGPGDMGAQPGDSPRDGGNPGGFSGSGGGADMFGGGGDNMFGGGGGGGGDTMQRAASALGVSQSQAMKNMKENREKFSDVFSDADDRAGIDTSGTKGKKGKEQGLLSKAIISGIASLAAGALTGGGSFVAQMVAGEAIKGGIKSTTGLEGLDVIGGITTGKFAAGGQVRDRVPAMLEPGEFVIRKPMAKAIGGAVLNQMNSTGRPPAINVNMTNQGAPKDVQVAPPKMNGDKMIVDIITRDMRNNGAIKKSIRKGR